MIVLLDTCVIIDALQDRKPFSENANNIFLACAEEKFLGCITAKAVTDIYYLCHRSTHSDKATREILGKLFKLFQVADSMGIDCKKALLSDTGDYEDAVMIETAARINADYIVTRNMKDYGKSSVKVVSPDILLNMLKN